jgi:hypothetical protein
LIPTLTIDGEELSENERLNKFLESGFLLIDAQENLIAPLRPAILTTVQLNNLMDTIILINPLNIIFLTNNNLNVITALSMHPEFNLISNKILINHLNGTHIFAFPSAPANPNIFSNQIEHARQYYFI